MFRFFIPFPLTTGAEVALPETVVRHIHVLRLQSGDPVTLFNGEGGEYRACLTRIAKKQADARVESFIAREAETPYRLTLAQGLTRGSKMDWLIEKAVELGVTSISPLIAHKSVTRLYDERAAQRLDHWQTLVEAACEQCGRNRVPVIHPVTDFSSWLTSLEKADSLRLMPSVRTTRNFDTLPATAPTEPALILIGPEGGLTESEEAQAMDHGFIPISLGTRILRTETAGIALMAALAARWGGW